MALDQGGRRTTGEPWGSLTNRCSRRPLCLARSCYSQPAYQHSKQGKENQLKYSVLRSNRHARVRRHTRIVDMMRDFAIGIEDHYGWAHLVSLAVSGSDLTLLDKRRIDLIDPHLPTSPCHHETLLMQRSDAEQLFRDVKESANRRAYIALESLVGELAPATCRAVAIRIPPLPKLPASIAEIHANPRITNRADGMIYHQALTSAAAQLNLSVFHFDKSRILELAAQVRGLTSADLETHLKALGRAGKPPWRKGHMLACAGVIVALGNG